MKNIFILFCLLTFCLSCSDQVTTEYSSYQKAVENDFIGMSWIPYELQDSSMSNIFIRSNLDLNTYIFSFSTEKVPTNIPPSLNQLTEPIEIHRVEIPNWWNDSIMNKPTTVFPTGHKTMVNLVLDEKNGIVYGWNEKSR